MHDRYFSKKYRTEAYTSSLENLHAWSSGTYLPAFCFIKIFDLSLTIPTPENR